LRFAICDLRIINWMTQPPTSRRIHLTNIALIVLAIVALYWQVFFLGRTIIDVDTLNNQLPWGYGANENLNHPYNRRDPTDMYLTREYFIVAAYRDGELPLWNPYTFTGHPIYADGVTRIFSPSLLVYTFLDLPVGYSIARLLELMLGAIFMYIFLIAIGVSPRGGLMGALVFELSAHSLFHLTGLGWWGGLMWLPLIFLFIDRAVTRNQFKYALLAGMFIALQFYSAYMPNQIYYLGAAVLYYIIFGWRVKKRLPSTNGKPLSSIRLLLMLSVTLAIGFALSATQWLPVMELLKYSNRRIVPLETSYIYLPPWYLVTLVFPNLFGTAYDPKMVNLFTALNVSHDHSLYLGIASLLPLGFLFEWLRIKRKSGQSTTGEARTHESAFTDIITQQRLRFFTGLVVFALVVMMAAPLYVHLTRFIPVLQTIRVIVRAGVLFTFAAPVLIGFGTDLLLKAEPEALKNFTHRSKCVLFAILIIAGLGVLVSYGLTLAKLGSPEDAVYVAGSGRLAYMKSVMAALASQFTPPKVSVFYPVIFLVMVYALLRLRSAAKITRQVFFGALVVLLIGDLFLNSLQFDRTHEASRVFPRTEITEKLKSLPPGRVLVAPSGIETNRRAHLSEEKVIAPPNTLLAYQIPTVTGKDQLFPKSYREFSSLIEPQDRLSHVVFDESASPYFDLLNVRYVVTHESAPAPPNHDLILKAEGLALYENRNVMPRAFFIKKVFYQISSKNALPERLLRADFDIRTEAVIGAQESPPTDLQIGDARITEDRRNRVTIETENAGDGLLVLSDNYYPGWYAMIDGQSTEILRANHTMRAVRVPAGRHVISFRFWPTSFTASAYFSLVAFIVVSAVLAMVQITEAKKNKAYDSQDD
jgi:hypothetical protein